MPHHKQNDQDAPMSWRQLKPANVFVSSVFFLLGAAFVYGFAIDSLKGLSHHNRHFEVAAFIFFYTSYLTLRGGKISHYLTGVMLTVAGFFLTLVLFAADATSYPYLIIPAGIFYFAYADYCLLSALWKGRKHIGNWVIIIFLLGVNCFPLYMGHLTLR